MRGLVLYFGTYKPHKITSINKKYIFHLKCLCISKKITTFAARKEDYNITRYIYEFRNSPYLCGYKGITAR